MLFSFTCDGLSPKHDYNRTGNFHGQDIFAVSAVGVGPRKPIFTWEVGTWDLRFVNCCIEKRLHFRRQA